MRSKLREIAGEVCRGEATSEHEAFIVASYKKAFGKNFAKCKCQLCDAIFLILKKLENMGEFTLKKGIVLTRAGKVYRLTHKTINDKLAREHLKAVPRDIKYFDKVPLEFRQELFPPPVKVEVQKPIPVVVVDDLGSKEPEKAAVHDDEGLAQPKRKRNESRKAKGTE
jgi:hypothetical protein